MKCKLSIVVLTYNRRDRIRSQIDELSRITYEPIEIIIVDNCSEKTIDDLIPDNGRFTLIRNNKNLGAVGRNIGISYSTGDFVLTLDDDVYGITDQHITEIINIFNNKKVAAINFKIYEEGSGLLTNWCHPQDSDLYSTCEFETYEISEGAAVFRKNALNDVGLYSEEFYISHEGPDLAFRLINAGWKVLYTPTIDVIHAHEKSGRSSWRRYYFDTRNLLWLVVRNYSFLYGLKKLFIGWTAMFIYSIRDGYFKYWLRGVKDSFGELSFHWNCRTPPKTSTIKKFKYIDKYRPTLYKKIMRRLNSGEVKI